MEIKSLSSASFNSIYEAFAKAFEAYEVRIDKKELGSMMKRRGFNADLSFAAFYKDEITAFTLNGTGEFNGISTAYDTGTGTVEDYRGRGLATQIFQYSIPYLKKAGIRQYLLEVIQHNTKAVSVYKKIGFETTREFNYFRQRNDQINHNTKPAGIPYTLERININNFSHIPSFWDFEPSWQNSFESIDRSKESFVSIGAFTGDKLIGYCVFEPVSGDITQIAVGKTYRRKGIGSALFGEILKLNRNDSIKIINTDISCTSITNFLESKNIQISGKQFEMIKEI